jgi:5-methylcytosine-specific restriction endonuclease McrA
MIIGAEFVLGGRSKKEIERRTKLIRADFGRVARTIGLREELFNKQSGRCLLCSRLPLDEWGPTDWELQGWDSVVSALDHFVSAVSFASRLDLTDEEAVSLANRKENLVLLHPSCNVVKGARDIEEIVEDIRAGRISLNKPRSWTPEEIEREKRRHSAASRKGGRTQGRRNVESGQLTSIASKGARKGGRTQGRRNVESGQIASIGSKGGRTRAKQLGHEGYVALGREGGSVGGRKGGRTQGRRNVESGHLASISRKGGHITNCLRWNIRRGKPCVCGRHV